VSVGVEHLRAARELFQQLGSTVWYERAGSLLAEGDLLPDDPPPDDGSATGLTRQVPLPA
jgi:hypothetical protein